MLRLKEVGVQGGIVVARGRGRRPRLTMRITAMTPVGARYGREFGGESPDRWAPAVTVGRAVTGGRLGSRMEMGRGCCSAGPVGRKTARDSFLPFFNSLFYLIFPAGEK
jgi:hypothetical protein